LRHLTLSVKDAAPDLVDGYRWREFLQKFIRLRTFDFAFRFDHDSTINVESPRVEEFRSDFWWHEKKWFVSAYPKSIFTVPRFSPSNIELLKPPSPPIWTTAFDITTCYENLKTVVFDPHIARQCQTLKPVCYKNVEHIRYFNVNRSILEPTIHVPLLKMSFDLSRVTSIDIDADTQPALSDFLQLIQSMDQLRKISLLFSSEFLRRLPPLPQIRHLTLYINQKHRAHFHKNLNGLCRVFHAIEYLEIPAPVSLNIVHKLSRKMKHLGVIIISFNDYFLLKSEMENCVFPSSINWSIVDNQYVGFWINVSEHHCDMKSDIPIKRAECSVNVSYVKVRSRDDSLPSIPTCIVCILGCLWLMCKCCCCGTSDC
jgi:hypothetical protein